VSGTSVSHLVLFIASLVVASSVAVAFTGQVGELTSAIDRQGGDLGRQIDTDVEVISDAGSPVYNLSGDGNVTLLVKNTGSATIPADSTGIDVLLDGRYQTGVGVTVLDGPVWSASTVARVEIAAPDLAAGDHRVKLVVNGDEEVFEFRT
jgi:flagellar protein FlaG